MKNKPADSDGRFLSLENKSLPLQSVNLPSCTGTHAAVWFTDAISSFFFPSCCQSDFYGNILCKLSTCLTSPFSSSCQSKRTHRWARLEKWLMCLCGIIVHAGPEMFPQCISLRKIVTLGEKMDSCWDSVVFPENRAACCPDGS